MFSFNVGKEHGVTESELARLNGPVRKAYDHLNHLMASLEERLDLDLEWAVLPYQAGKTIDKIQQLGNEIAAKFENVLSLGIGGSYLGLKAAQDALCPPYYNEFKNLRHGRPKIYFEGNNLDPAPLKVLLKNLDPKKTCCIVISKSGETAETKAAFDVVADWLKKGVGRAYGRRIFAITDLISGSLRKRVNEEQRKDPLSFRNLPLLPGVGGRYSELNMGLLHLAVIGVDINEVLAGARAMSRRCNLSSLYKNPALLYATLHYIAYKAKGKSIAVMMPFSESLKSTADWYCQLLAESLGKKYARKIVVKEGKIEEWLADKKRVVHVGRTPVPSRGTTDLHSIQQNNVEGENNKTVTMIRVENFSQDLKVPAGSGLLSGKSFSRLLALAQEATAWALVKAQRPNCTVVIPVLSPFLWGELLYFFEMATAFEGELLGVNAYNQPGVESYKNYMQVKLHKPGMSSAVAQEIKSHPVKKYQRFVL